MTGTRRWAAIALAAACAGCGNDAGEAKMAAVKNEPRPAAQAAPAAVDPEDVRKTAVAGKFYPADPRELSAAIAGYLKAATPREFADPVRAVIVPHAGYVFSAPVAAHAFRQLQGREIDRVVLLGCPHFVRVDGAVIWTRGAWNTPLGSVPVDEAAARAMIDAAPRLREGRWPHEPDHCLEVQLPFLQTVLAAGFRIVPILVSTDREEDFAAVAAGLRAVCDRRTVVVVSTDLAHYPRKADAEGVDARTLESWKSLDAAQVERVSREQMAGLTVSLECTMCGLDAVLSVLKAAPALGVTALEVVRAANSAAASGDESRVVGYGAAVLTGKPPAEDLARGPAPAAASREESFVSPEAARTLLAVARQAIEAAAAGRKPAPAKSDDPLLRSARGCFVTLFLDRRLRGCIGRIETEEPLLATVQAMAMSSAMRDPRFSPVTPAEVPRLEIEISVLSESAPCPDWRAIVLGKHGVVLRGKGTSGVFLPQVATETGWSLEQFLDHLAEEKAGLDREAWRSPDVSLFTFTVQKLRE